MPPAIGFSKPSTSVREHALGVIVAEPPGTGSRGLGECHPGCRSRPSLQLSVVQPCECIPVVAECSPVTRECFPLVTECFPVVLEHSATPPKLSQVAREC